MSLDVNIVKAIKTYDALGAVTEKPSESTMKGKTHLLQLLAF